MALKASQIKGLWLIFLPKAVLLYRQNQSYVILAPVCFNCMKKYDSYFSDHKAQYQKFNASCSFFIDRCMKWSKH